MSSSEPEREEEWDVGGGRPRVAEGLCEETLNNFASLKGKM